MPLSTKKKHLGDNLGNEGSVFQDLDRVILDEARMQQTHIRSIQTQNFLENLIITHSFKVYKTEMKKVLQKIENIYGSV
jgi:hypothetical protein